MAKAHYNDCVFLNCPFDAAYDPIMKASVFAVLHCGFVPRCSKEEQDSAVVRMDKLFRLIKSCKYGIHDISRTEFDPTTHLPRFNMPLELGVFLGAKRYGGHPNSKKKCLVLDREQFRYQQYISDIAGQDIRAHADSPQNCVTLIRNWLSSQSGHSAVPTGDVIWNNYQLYLSELPALCAAVSQTPHMLTYSDYVRLTVKWLRP
jgi:hypothetical protein